MFLKSWRINKSCSRWDTGDAETGINDGTATVKRKHQICWYLNKGTIQLGAMLTSQTVRNVIVGVNSGEHNLGILNKNKKKGASVKAKTLTGVTRY
jgi:hypothetical protein